MPWGTHHRKGWSANVALALIMFALALRILVPSGFMPAQGQGLAITLCTGTGAVSAWVDSDGTVHKGKAADAAPEHPCTFSGFGAVFDLPDHGAASVQPLRLVEAPLFVARTAVAIGRGLAAPPPPSTGPPASL